MQTKPNTQLVARLALAIVYLAVLCPAQQNVGAVARGVTISFQNARGSTDRGVSVGFQDASGTIQVTTNVAAASFTIKGPATYTGNGLSFTQANAPVGTYTISYGVVPGYTTPVSETKALAVAATLAFTGSYAPLPGIGRIQVTTNHNAARFTVAALTDTPGFATFSGTGRFYDTLLSVPAGTYRIAFGSIAGYFTPPAQTLTLSAGQTIAFTGTYKRVVVFLFTGFNNSPSPRPDDGVTYPDVCPADYCPGMAQLAMDLRNNPQLREGVVARTFTYYDVSDWVARLDLAPLLPASDAPHVIANAWLSDLIAGDFKLGPDDRTVIVGHSYGGNRARLFAEQLPSLGRVADLLVTVDPIDWNSCSLQNPTGGCYQFEDAQTKIKAPSIGDVQSFTQISNVVMGYHFVDFPYTVKTYPPCALDPADVVCSHMRIDDDDSVHDAIAARIVTLRDDPRDAVYGIAVTSTGPNSATVTWKTGSTTAGGGVVYTLNNDGKTNGVEVAESTPAGVSHSATIAGLAPNTTYYFRIRSKIYGSTNSLYSSVGFFRTTASGPVIKASNPVLTRNASGTSLTVTVTNTGASATNGTISAASIGAAKTTLTLPQPVPDLATGTSFYPAIPFPASIGASGATVYPVLTFKYSGMTFSVPVPAVKVP